MRLQWPGHVVAMIVYLCDGKHFFTIMYALVFQNVHKFSFCPFSEDYLFLHPIYHEDTRKQSPKFSAKKTLPSTRDLPTNTASYYVFFQTLNYKRVPKLRNTSYNFISQRPMPKSVVTVTNTKTVTTTCRPLWTSLPPVPSSIYSRPVTSLPQWGDLTHLTAGKEQDGEHFIFVVFYSAQKVQALEFR